MAVIVKYTVMTSVILLMLAVGSRTPFSQVREVVKNRSLLMRGLLANFVVAPVTAGVRGVLDVLSVASARIMLGLAPAGSPA